MDIQQTIGELRFNIDAAAQTAKALVVQDAEKSLYYAKAWLGKLLGEFPGNSSPYKNDGKRKTVADIEPTDSVTDHSGKTSYSSIVEGIDVLRQTIGEILNKVQTLSDLPTTREAAICRTQVWVYLNEARFALGFELQRIRENSLK